MWLGIGLGKRERAYVAIIVTYDIVRNKRRTKLHWFLRELGINTKKSEFECEVSREELRLLRRYPDARLDMREDSLNIYHLCSRCAEQAEVQVWQKS